LATGCGVVSRRAGPSVQRVLLHGHFTRTSLDWTLARKIKLVVDSIVSFTDLPIRLCWYGGAALLALAVVVGVIGIAQLPTLGAALLLMLSVVLGLAGLQLIALGLIGEYVWRTLDAARGRPNFVVAETRNVEPRASVPHAENPTPVESR